MPRFTRKQDLRRSIQEERHSRKNLLNNKITLLANLGVKVAMVHFLFRLLHALRLNCQAVTTEDRKKAFLVTLVGLLELIPALNHNYDLLRLGYRLREQATSELEVLDQALLILNKKRFVLNRICRGRKELRNAWFSQVLIEGGDGFIKLVSYNLLKLSDIYLTEPTFFSCRLECRNHLLIT